MSTARSTLFGLAITFTPALALAQAHPPYHPQQQQQPPPRTTYSTNIAGTELVDGDDDTDIAVGRARINAASPGQRDIIESEPERRREVHGEHITAAPLVAYATNDLHAGVGARAGYTFGALPIYVGGTFLYHFGSNDTRFMYPAAEGGYDLGIGPVLVRPYVGAGVLVERTSNDAGSATDTGALVYPGLTGHYYIGNTRFYVGADTRVLMPLAAHSASFSAALTAGLGL